MIKVGALFYLFLFSLNAEVLNFDIIGYQRKIFSYREVCRSMGVKETLLVEAKDMATLNCMGFLVELKNFCLMEFGGDYFLRGYANPKMQEIVCERGSKAYLKIACDKKHKKFCENPKKSCGSLKQAYAYSHRVVEASLIKKPVDHTLNCYFAGKEPSIKGLRLERDSLGKILDPVIDPDLFSAKK